MEDMSDQVHNALVQASMLATSTTTQAPRFQAPGSESESVTAADVRPLAQPVPPVSAKFVAGPGDRGGTVHGAGTAPGDGWEWEAVPGA